MKGYREPLIFQHKNKKLKIKAMKTQIYLTIIATIFANMLVAQTVINSKSGKIKNLEVVEVKDSWLVIEKNGSLHDIPFEEIEKVFWPDSIYIFNDSSYTVKYKGKYLAELRRIERGDTLRKPISKIEKPRKTDVEPIPMRQIYLVPGGVLEQYPHISAGIEVPLTETVGCYAEGGYCFSNYTTLMSLYDLSSARRIEDGFVVKAGIKKYINFRTKKLKSSSFVYLFEVGYSEFSNSKKFYKDAQQYMFNVKMGPVLRFKNNVVFEAYWGNGFRNNKVYAQYSDSRAIEVDNDVDGFIGVKLGYSF